jgi:hypothetical protein
MPLYYYGCPTCKNVCRRILDVDAAEHHIQICKCGLEMERADEGARARITETLDNGVMVRKLERYADAENIYKEWADGKKGAI